MDLNAYLVEVLAAQRLAELRAMASRTVARRALAAPSRPLRVVAGHALLRLGAWLAGPGASLAARSEVR